MRGRGGQHQVRGEGRDGLHPDRRSLLGFSALLAWPGCGAWSDLPPPNWKAVDPAAWRARLTADQFAVLRGGATEAPGSSPLDHERRTGTYACAGCDSPLFRSADKFDSGTGWPSFTRAVRLAITTSIDRSMAIERVAVACSRCDGHLGHLFKDGPPPTGLRYCINGAALTLTPGRG